MDLRSDGSTINATRKPPIAQPDVTQYAADAPCESMTRPANGVAIAIPTAIPEPVQDMVSVNRCAGTMRSTRLIPEIRAGEQATPASISPPPIHQMFGRNGNGSVTTARAAIAIPNCLSSDDFNFATPKI